MIAGSHTCPDCGSTGACRIGCERDHERLRRHNVALQAELSHSRRVVEAVRAVLERYGSISAGLVRWEYRIYEVVVSLPELQDGIAGEGTRVLTALLAACEHALPSRLAPGRERGR